MEARPSLIKLGTLGLITASMFLSGCSKSKPAESADRGAYSSQGTTAAAFTKGVPGGTIVDTTTLTARVDAIDPATRKITLVEPDGKKTVIKAGPEVVNFDQIKVGDQLKATVESEVVVSVRPAGSPSSYERSTSIAGAEKGERPGVAMTDSAEVTATITSIDQKKRRATVRFPDGRTVTVRVRPDVDLTKVSTGDQVVIRATDAVAIVVETPAEAAPTLEAK